MYQSCGIFKYRTCKSGFKHCRWLHQRGSGIIHVNSANLFNIDKLKLIYVSIWLLFYTILVTYSRKFHLAYITGASIVAQAIQQKPEWDDEASNGLDLNLQVDINWYINWTMTFNSYSRFEMGFHSNLNIFKLTFTSYSRIFCWIHHTLSWRWEERQSSSTNVHVAVRPSQILKERGYQHGPIVTALKENS